MSEIKKIEKLLGHIMEECAFHEDEENGWVLVRNNCRYALEIIKGMQP